MAPSSIYDIPLRRIDGTDVTLAEYRGKTLLIVNTASRCGLTAQYQGLEALYRKYEKRGLCVLGFPCNQFLNQEPGDEAIIAQFCKLHYDVSFPMFAKVEVNGHQAHPLFRLLKEQARGPFWSQMVQWNFTKFVVGPDGTILKRFSPSTKPEQLEAFLVAQLPGHTEALSLFESTAL
jgi:glutathione peroxidase